MELGGNAPFIVFDDADLDARGRRRDDLASSATTARPASAPTGSTCRPGVYDAFAEKLAVAVEKLKVGDGLEDGTDLGPLINAGGRGEGRGAYRRRAGRRRQDRRPAAHRHALGGTFFEPTVVTGVTPEMKVSTEETFGPLRAALHVRDRGRGDRLANDTIFGLASYFYARDIGRITRVQEALEYGMVGVNTGLISHRSRAVRRRQAVRPGPRRQPSRDRGLPGDEIHLHKHLTLANHHRPATRTVVGDFNDDLFAGLSTATVRRMSGDIVLFSYLSSGLRPHARASSPFRKRPSAHPCGL